MGKYKKSQYKKDKFLNINFYREAYAHINKSNDQLIKNWYTVAKQYKKIGSILHFKMLYPCFKCEIYKHFNKDLTNFSDIELMIHWHENGQYENRIYSSKIELDEIESDEIESNESVSDENVSDKIIKFNNNKNKIKKFAYNFYKKCISMQIYETQNFNELINDIILSDLNETIIYPYKHYILSNTKFKKIFNIEKDGKFSYLIDYLLQYKFIHKNSLMYLLENLDFEEKSNIQFNLIWIHEMAKLKQTYLHFNIYKSKNQNQNNKFILYVDNINYIYFVEPLLKHSIKLLGYDWKYIVLCKNNTIIEYLKTIFTDIDIVDIIDIVNNIDKNIILTGNKIILNSLFGILINNKFDKIEAYNDSIMILSNEISYKISYNNIIILFENLKRTKETEKTYRIDQIIDMFHTLKSNTRLIPIIKNKSINTNMIISMNYNKYSPKIIVHVHNNNIYNQLNIINDDIYNFDIHEYKSYAESLGISCYAYDYYIFDKNTNIKESEVPFFLYIRTKPIILSSKSNNGLNYNIKTFDMNVNDIDYWKIHCNKLLQYFVKDLYLKQDNKPVILFEDINKITIDILNYLNNITESKGFDGLYIMNIKSNKYINLDKIRLINQSIETLQIPQNNKIEHEIYPHIRYINKKIPIQQQYKEIYDILKYSIDHNTYVFINSLNDYIHGSSFNQEIYNIFKDLILKFC